MLGFFVIWLIFTIGILPVIWSDEYGASFLDNFLRAAGYAFAFVAIALILGKIFGFDGLEYSDRFSS